MFYETLSPLPVIEKTFNGSQEHESAPIPLTGQLVLERVEDINTIFGKTQKKLTSKSCISKKRSILFDPPYWFYLDIRHCIDVMHVEKMCVIVSSKHFLTFMARQRMV